MPNYQYHAIDDTGKLSRGTIVAFNEPDVEERLRQSGLTLIKSKPARTGSSTKSLFQGKVKTRILIELYHRFAQSLRIGLPILGALDENIKMIPCRRLKKVIEEVRVSVENGNSLYQSMEQFPDVFSKLDLNIVMMGEQSGTLPESLGHLAGFLEWREDLKSTIKRATIYPSFIMVALLVVVGVWVGYVLPQMVKVISEMGVKLPGMTKGVLGVSLFLQGNWLWLLGGVMILVALFYAFQRNTKGKVVFHKYLLKIPLMGQIICKIAIARLSHYFSVLMESGMAINTIFEMLKGGVLGNAYLEGQLAIAHQEIQHGQTISDGFDKTKGFPPLLVGAIRNGELTGTLSESFSRLGDYYDNEVKRNVQAMVNAFEPITMGLLGGIFGIVVLSILLPLYDVIGGLGKAY
ncbi:MAG: type II secretion system F family protein [Thermodesulfobacteriota bacterium]|nr:type II secretion system F family protein [Thermodesulfobacteriota bacterium]